MLVTKLIDKFKGVVGQANSGGEGKGFTERRLFKQQLACLKKRLA